jgi:hypothetical protein
VQQDVWYPNTLLEILGALAYGVAVLAFALGMVKRLWIKPLHDAIRNERKAREEAVTDEANARAKDLNGQGSRIAEIATEATKAVGRVEIIERGQEGVRRDCSGLHEAMGELKAQVQMLAQMQQANEVARATDLGAISRQIAVIETELRLMREARTRGERA